MLAIANFAGHSMAHERVTRRLAAIVAADMVGYSRLMQLDEAGTVTRQKTCLDELINPKIKEYGGRLVKTTGDGILVEFPSAVDAVLCSVTIQREMAARESDVTKDRRIQYRVGINLGEIIIEGDDIFGDGVNIASRLEALAEPGGIRISQAVFNNVKGKLDLGFSDLGLQKVKNIAEPIPTYQILLDPEDVGKFIEAKFKPSIGARGISAVVAVMLAVALIAGYFAWDRFMPADKGEKKLLIVPLIAQNADSRQVADAATENLIASFARLKGLTIAPHAVSMEYKGIDVSTEDLSEKLGIHYVLDGSVSRIDEKITLTARLRNTSGSGEGVVWEQSEDGQLGQLFDLLATIKLSAAGALKVTLDHTERAILKARPTENIEAYLAFVHAEQFLYGGNFSKLKAALPLFERAMELDQNFLEAQLGYAESNFLIWSKSYNTIRFTPDAFDAMQQTIAQIVKKYPQNPFAVGLQIRIKIEKLNREQALSEAQSAIFLHQDNLDHPWLKYVLGLALMASGDYQGAKDQFESYERLSPRLNSAEIRELARQYVRMNEVRKALSLLASVPSKEANELAQYYLLAQAHARNGDIAIAKNNMNKVLKTIPWLNLSWYRPRFDIYSDPGIFENWAAAMSAAGMPEWPHNFDKGRAADKLKRDDLIELYSDQFHVTHDKGPYGAPYKQIRRADGTIEMEFGWLKGSVFTGKWNIKGDRLCESLVAIHMGRESCFDVYIDRKKSTNDVKHISSLWPPGVVHSVFTRVKK
jgi:adenylate cyclase